MRIFTGIFFLLLSLSLAHPTVSVQSNTSKEYQVKAAFLFHFTRFVEWPSHTFPAGDAPLVIGILGENPFGTYLESMIAGESVGHHPLVVHKYESVTEIKDCHILFISETDDEELARILNHLKDRNILTVGEGEDFGLQGGVIGFIPNADRIGIQINARSAKRANLVISSKLLRLAQIVTTEPNQ